VKLALLVLGLLALPAFADELRLANGDRIQGEITARSGERLVVKTGFAGEIAVRLSDVASISIADADGVVHEIGPAQVAAFDPRAYRRERAVAYSGRALLSAAYARGNAPSDQLHADGLFTARARKYRYELSGRIDQRSAPGEQSESAWLTGANYDRFLDGRQFLYARGSLEHDAAKDIDARAALGAGYGVQLAETAAASVSLRGGLDYVAVDRVVEPSEEYPAFGWGIRASYKPFRAPLELFHEQEGFWNLEDTDVVTLRSKTGVRVPLVDRFNATAQLNVDWERRPAPGRASTDSTLLLGVDYSF
jgi:putative salt-induced outer membrane protein YdiY